MPVYWSGLDAYLFVVVVPVIPSSQSTVPNSHSQLPLVGLLVLFLQLTLQGQKSCFIHSRNLSTQDRSWHAVGAVSLFVEQMNKQGCQPEEVTPELRLVKWVHLHL